ncbi:MAG: hypothetical protein V1648_00030 [Candidatus Aenigmatarchaeota archaeon]
MDPKKREEEARKRLKNGWIKVGFMIEAMAISKTAVESALKKHVEKMEKEKGVIIIRKEFKPTADVKKPLPNIEKGYSQIVDVELVAESFDKLIYMSMNYGPSAIEILEPNKITMDFGEAQGILNSIASVMHTFAAMRGGGVLVST